MYSANLSVFLRQLKIGRKKIQSNLQIWQNFFGVRICFQIQKYLYNYGTHDIFLRKYFISEIRQVVFKFV